VVRSLGQSCSTIHGDRFGRSGESHQRGVVRVLFFGPSSRGAHPWRYTPVPGWPIRPRGLGVKGRAGPHPRSNPPTSAAQTRAGGPEAFSLPAIEALVPTCAPVASWKTISAGGEIEKPPWLRLLYAAPYRTEVAPAAGSDNPALGVTSGRPANPAGHSMGQCWPGGPRHQGPGAPGEAAKWGGGRGKTPVSPSNSSSEGGHQSLIKGVPKVFFRAMELAHPWGDGGRAPFFETGFVVRASVRTPRAPNRGRVEQRLGRLIVTFGPAA